VHKFKIARVNGKTYREVIDELQGICLPTCKKYNPEIGYWWLAKHKDKPIGYLGLTYTKNEAWYLCRCGVIPEYRGHGIMKQMVKAMARFAKKYNLFPVYTDTTDNPASANSLIGCGFKTISPSKQWAFKRSIYWVLRG